MTDLDERKAAILRAIVEQYVETAQPVGSQTVTHRTELGVSAATVRNEMSVLEREGYIAQPHTSAGRVPTDRGYRYYVDHLAGANQLAAPERRRVAEFFTSATMAMDELLLQTSQLLARVSAHAAVVIGPEHQAVVVRSAHLVSLQPRVALVVIVLSNGSVEKEVVSFAADVSEDDVADASARVAQLLNGRRLTEIATLLTAGAHGNPANRSHRRRRVGGGARTPRSSRHRGVVRRRREPARRPNTTRSSPRAPRVCSNCSNSTPCIASVLRDLLGPGLTVRIGAENGQADLRECSLVLAPYLIEGEVAGTLGVLGPTRMDYRKAQAAVFTVSQQLGRQLSP